MTPRAYADAWARFSWQDSLDALSWSASADVNLADTILERHAGAGRRALRWLGKTGTERTYTFDELARLATRVAGYLPRVPETLAVMLGTSRATEDRKRKDPAVPAASAS